ncbi:Signal peptide protein [Candidatus Filomicrobium marinum]|uniref:Signal peptide protein n=1 Tax=Candidatus Filomicrobium marinum TaxID=1608628 RepID=A0A0D6JDH6_9HYPH|nr:SgcJ/EcaC family oxidoreductase [Candidatus Filomicrobium marinum]CFX15013.1 Signal peptide protein [Candidatus Filomicrobium marinum]CPR17892.1 Signal peptide protein [Candidatus Filomicrobium marinum]
MINSTMTLGSSALRRGAFAVALVAGLAFSGSTFADDLSSMIKAGNSKWDAAFNSGDAAAVAKLYAEDAQVLPPGQSPVNGAEGIEKFFAGVIGAGYTDHKIETLKVTESGNLRVQTGRWQAMGPADEGGKRKAAEGSIVTVHEKQNDGTWKMQVHIFN